MLQQIGKDFKLIISRTLQSSWHPVMQQLKLLFICASFLVNHTRLFTVAVKTNPYTLVG